MRQEGLLSSATYQLTPRWSVNLQTAFDLDRYLGSRQNYIDAYNYFQTYRAAYPSLEEPIYRHPALWTPISTSMSVGYTDECTTFSVNYTRGIRLESVAVGEKDRVQTVLVRLELRSLGELNFRQNLGIQGSPSEGVAAQ
jgi:LPS-assembly protein